MHDLVLLPVLSYVAFFTFPTIQARADLIVVEGGEGNGRYVLCFYSPFILVVIHLLFLVSVEKWEGCGAFQFRIILYIHTLLCFFFSILTSLSIKRGNPSYRMGDKPIDRSVVFDYSSFVALCFLIVIVLSWTLSYLTYFISFLFVLCVNGIVCDFLTCV